MTVTPTTIKARFSEFSTISDSKIQIFIDDAITVLNESYWGDKYDLGLYYLAAHYLTIGTASESGSSGGVGPVSGKAVDGTSITYAQMTPTNEGDALLASTIYGQRYLALRKTLGVPASVI